MLKRKALIKYINDQRYFETIFEKYIKYKQ